MSIPLQVLLIQMNQDISNTRQDKKRNEQKILNKSIIKRIDEVWMARTLQNNVRLLKLFDDREAFDPVCKGPAL